MNEDLEVLEKQLGRKPRNLVRVEKRCSAGYPQVITTAPLLESDKEPGIFPTTYWLTCPELNYRISQLEDKGWIKKLEQKIAEDEKLAGEVSEAHQRYIQARVELISAEDLQQLEEKFPGQYRVLTESGVGGILNSTGIKCLHTHYAHYLADKNPVGELVNELLVEKFSDLEPADCRYQCERGSVK